MSSSLPAFGSLNGSSGSGTPSWSSSGKRQQTEHNNGNSNGNRNNNNSNRSNGSSNNNDQNIGNSIYHQTSTSTPVNTPPNNSFTSGLQFNSSSNGNNLFQRGQGQGHTGGFNPITAANPDHSSLFGSSSHHAPLATPTFGLSAASTAASGSASASASTSPTLRTANRISMQSNSFLSQQQQQHSHSQQHEFGGLASSSSLGLRQRNAPSASSAATGTGTGGIKAGVGAPPPKRSMMNMTMDKTFSNHGQAQSHSSNSISMNKENQPLNMNGNIHSTSPISGFPIKGDTRNSNIANKSISNLEYNKWVILHGFSNSSQCQAILSKFDKLGTVVSKYPSLVHDSTFKGNWICVKYDSELQANKALCQHGTLMDVDKSACVSASASASASVYTGGNGGGEPITCIVGVMSMDEAIASRLGLKQFLNQGGVGDASAGVGASTGAAIRFNGGKTARMGTTSTRLNERDVLLSGDEHEQRQRRATGNRDAVVAERDGICYKALAWIFEW